MKKVCVITGSRAEYGLFYPILKKINESLELELQLIATTMHLSKDHGLTYQCIEVDGFNINSKIDNLKSGESNVLSYARLMNDLPIELEHLAPDLILLLGDRFETHAAATTSCLMNIPIAHIHGGEITQGAVDEQLRHSITKMSQLHFTSTQEYANRVIQMGENPKNVIVSGAPGIDNILSITLKPLQQLEKELSWQFGQKTALFTYHAETLSNSPIKETICTLLNYLQKTNISVLFTGANADSGGNIINQQIKKFVKSNPLKYKFVHNLGMINYFSAMKYVNLVIGNSSSGIIEAASFDKPVIDIGDRQKGRLTSGNVVNCSVAKLGEVLTEFNNRKPDENKEIVNIYGAGNAASIIVSTLINTNTIQAKKIFRDIKI